jgi:GxxExxY protein
MEERNDKKYKLRRGDIVYSELSYKICGILFEVFRKMGAGFQEKYYQRAVGVALCQAGLKNEEQLMVPMVFESKDIGRYFLDFLIEDKIILEIKKGDYYHKQNIEQVKAYLKAKKLKLGLIANFTSRGVTVKRIININ